MATISPVGNNVQYANYINAASDKYQVPATLIAAVIKQESGFQKNIRSGAGAAGLMQLMPSTAASLGVSNVWDPGQNIDGGTKYLASQLHNFNGSIPLALAAYNAGPGNVIKAGGNIPNIPETQNYVKSIMANYAGGNIDPGSLSNVDGSAGSGTNPLDIGATIVNGFQKIFQTIATDTVKFFIMIILFSLFIFFGYKAISTSGPVNEGILTTKRTAKSVKRTYTQVKNNQAQKAGQDRAARLAKRKAELEKVALVIPK